MYIILRIHIIFWLCQNKLCTVAPKIHVHVTIAQACVRTLDVFLDASLPL